MRVYNSAMDQVRFSIEYTLQDLRYAFRLYYWKLFLKMLLPDLIILFYVLLIGWGYYMDPSSISYIDLLYLPLIIIIFAPIILFRKGVQNYEKNYKQWHVDFSCDQNGYTVVSLVSTIFGNQKTEFFFQWSGFRSYVENKHSILFYAKPHGTVFFIPKRVFSSAKKLAAFKAYLKKTG